MQYKWWAAAAIAAGVAVPAQAQPVSAKNPDTLVQALQAGGYAAKLDVDGIGDPMILSSHAGSAFRVLFYGCKANKDCETIQFYAGYDKKSETGLASINEWNRTKRFGRAYLDAEGDPILAMDVDLDDGGVSKELFTDNLQFWASVKAAFEEHIGWAKE